jgi:hypothetical protein
LDATAQDTTQPARSQSASETETAWSFYLFLLLLLFFFFFFSSSSARVGKTTIKKGCFNSARC